MYFFPFIEDDLNTDSISSSFPKVECFFKSSTRLTEIPTQVICTCTKMDSYTSKTLGNHSTKDLTNGKFGKFHNSTSNDEYVALDYE